MEEKPSLYCFELEDMSSITPFWQWLDGRIPYKGIYTEPKDFEAILKGQKKPDANKFLFIGETNNEAEGHLDIPCTYNGETTEIVTATAQRLSDHRFKMELIFWEPEGWPNDFLWEIFNKILKDLRDDYPDAKRTLRKGDFGFYDEDFKDTQEPDPIRWSDEPLIDMENTNMEPSESLLSLRNYLKACIAWVDRPYMGSKEINEFLSSTFGTDNGFPNVSKGRFYRFLQLAVNLELIKKDGRYYRLAYKTRAEALKRLEYIIQNWNSIRTQ